MAAPQVHGVLDLTFLDIRDESDFQTHLSQQIEVYHRAHSPSKRPPSELDSPKSTRKETIKAIRLGNNYLESIEIIHSIPAQLDSSKILWLDLSFNYITAISEEFALYFPQVTTIYLHANKLAKLTEIKKLGKFAALRSLSLYGNPVEEHKHYRNYVLYYCPHLAQFDKSPVTKTQHSQVEVWAQTFRRKLNPSEEDF